MRETRSIDIGGVKPLVGHAEIHIGRTIPPRPVNTGKPSYKSQEEQYQEIQDLRRSFGELRESHANLKAKCRKLEGDVIKRDRQIEQLMDPTKNDEGRRKLTDKGASLVASLKLRVSRLESTLREKEAQLAKIQSSTKTTTINELKVQAETYYQEVVRLRNQLNISHHQRHGPPAYYTDGGERPAGQEEFAGLPGASNLPSFTFRSPSADVEVINTPIMSPNQSAENVNFMNMTTSHRSGGDGSESPTAVELRNSLSKLQEENSRLMQHINSINTEKDKVATDLDRVLGLSDDIKKTYDGMSRAELIREIQRTHDDIARWEHQHKALTDALSHRSDTPVDNSTTLLQARVSELQGRELEWERERVSLKELINTLKEDRLFYKENSQKKDSEMDSLRQEISSLQREVMALHSSAVQRQTRTTTSRTPRTPSRQPTSSGSRSGSSSEQQTPTRKPRPTSARPLSASSRSSSSKAASEPREMKKTSSSKVPIKSTRMSSSASASSTPSKGPISRNRPGSLTSNRMSSSASASSTPKETINRSRPGSLNNTRSTMNGNRSSISSGSTPGSAQASPRRVPSKPPSNNTTRSSSISKSSNYRSPSVASPRSSLHTDKSVSPQRKSSMSTTSRTSPSKSSTKPSQSSNTSAKPKKTSTSSTTKTSRLVNGRTKHIDDSSSPASSPRTNRRKCSTEEDISEKALLALLRPPDIDSGSESMTESQGLVRQRTMTLSVHTDDGDIVNCNASTVNGTLNGDISSINEDTKTTPIDTHLERQKTVTLTKSSLSMTDSEIIAQCIIEGQQDSEESSSKEKKTIEEKSSMEQKSIEETSSMEEKSSVERKSIEKSSSRETKSLEEKDGELFETEESQDNQVLKNLDLLRALISAHLSRQIKVNELLLQEPVLVNDNIKTTKQT